MKIISLLAMLVTFFKGVIAYEGIFIWLPSYVWLWVSRSHNFEWLEYTTVAPIQIEADAPLFSALLTNRLQSTTVQDFIPFFLLFLISMFVGFKSFICPSTLPFPFPLKSHDVSCVLYNMFIITLLTCTNIWKVRSLAWGGGDGCLVYTSLACANFESVVAEIVI